MENYRKYKRSERINFCDQNILYCLRQTFRSIRIIIRTCITGIKRYKNFWTSKTFNQTKGNKHKNV